MSDVTIDRLVLELPGMDADAARALALGVAEGLAAADLTGDHDRFTVVVDPASAGTTGLAAHIVQSLLRRIG
jgi:hypothetical protein